MIPVRDLRPNKVPIHPTFSGGVVYTAWYFIFAQGPNGAVAKAWQPQANRPRPSTAENQSAPALLALRHIRVAYTPGQTALEIPALEIHAGQSYAVVGPNGAGKSTLFKVLTLLVHPQQGQVVWRGQDILHTPAWSPKRLRQHVVLVHQHPVMLRTSVFRNVAYGLHIRRIPRPEIIRRVAAALSWVCMERHATRPARSLSGGEAQRVALARALVVEPAVLLLDEPTANLDAQSCAIIEALIQDLKAKHGRTVLFTTHDMAQASRLSDGVIALAQGRIVTSSLTPVEPNALAPHDAAPCRTTGRCV